MNALANLMSAVSAFILGPFGISVIGVGVAGGFLGAAINMIPVSFALRGLLYGACAFSVAWAVSLF